MELDDAESADEDSASYSHLRASNVDCALSTCSCQRISCSQHSADCGHSILLRLSTTDLDGDGGRPMLLCFFRAAFSGVFLAMLAFC